jgi:divalent metal cation (Fe/Co/Zn/Cd) transporter
VIAEALRRALRPVDSALVERLVRAAADAPAVGTVSEVSVRRSFHGVRVRMTIGLPGEMSLADAQADLEQASARVRRFVGPRGRVELRLEALPAGWRLLEDLGPA